MESRQIIIGRGGVWGSLGVSLTQLSTEIHFWILFLSYWLGTAPGALFYVNSWERITELGDQGKRGKKQIRESSEMIQRCAGWAWLPGRAMCTHSHPPISISVVFINDGDFHSLPHFLYISSWKRSGFDEMDFCPAPGELCNPAQSTSSS